MFNIVLVEPEIPQNTGNIVRTCAATGCRLHLVKPLGFEVSDKYLKRAGLDYWHMTEIFYYENLNDFFAKNAIGDFYYFSTKAKQIYCDVAYKNGDYLIFGKETKGLSEELLKENYDKTVRIPMIDESRSLNLSNSVAIALYEAQRQNGFKGLKAFGKLTKYEI